MIAGRRVPAAVFDFATLGTMLHRSLFRRWLALALLIAAGLLATSCGGGNANPATSSAPNPQPASLTLNANGIDFGNVAVGSSKSNTITLTNASSAGAASVAVTQIGATGSGFGVTASTLPFTLAPGQSSSLTVIFSPASAGAASGQLSITAQGASQPISIPLTGTGLGPGQLVVSPSSMDFGNVAVGSTQSKTGTLTAGSSDVNISSASLTSQDFSLTGITLPMVVTAGTSVSFTVNFTPLVTGSLSDQLSFISDATNPPTSVALSGSGTMNVQHSVDLSWNASTSQVSGYNIYRGSQSGGPYTKLNSTLISALTFTDTTVQSGTTYFYVSTAVDANSVESAYSNEATAVIP